MCVELLEEKIGGRGGVGVLTCWRREGGGVGLAEKVRRRSDRERVNNVFSRVLFK